MSASRTLSPPILLVCVPGTLCNGRAFEPFVDQLRRRGLEVRQFTVDTTHVPTAQGTANQALAAMAPAPDEQIVFIGFSLGGCIALLMTLLSTTSPAGLILLDVNGEADKPGNDVNRRAAVQRSRDHGLANFVTDELWPTHVAKSHSDDIALRELAVRMAEESGPDAFANQAEIAISRPRALDLLPRVTVPTLVLCGAEDTVTPVTMSEAIAASAPHSRFEIIEDAGHFAVFERPTAVADLVAPWIRDLSCMAAAEGRDPI